MEEGKKEIDTLRVTKENIENYSNLMSNIREKECDGVYIID